VNGKTALDNHVIREQGGQRNVRVYRSSQELDERGSEECDVGD
jgi:hypothetical protein